MNKFKSFFNGSDENDKDVAVEENYYNEDKQSFLTEGGSKMILLEPRAYSESQAIADYLKSRNAVVVNLKRVTPDQAKRIVDFLSGTLYAIGGDLQKLGGGIFLCTPNNVNVEGKMSDDSDKGLKGKPKDKEDELYF
ncbi:MAG: cell division protein SepF [Bacilli bacterium]